MAVGILGGAFDPPHDGHVALARRAIERFGLDRLLVTVVADPGHKEVDASAEDRLALATLAFADVRGAEVWLIGASISEYDHGNVANHVADRDRKLLLHKREIASLVGKVNEKGLTLVPTRLYFKDGKVKVEIALARGKERLDKRRDLAERDAKRQIERALRGRGRD